MRKLLQYVFSLLIPGQAFAIVNIETTRVEKNADWFSGELELDLDLLSSITDSKQVSLGNRLQWDLGNKTNSSLPTATTAKEAAYN